MMVDICWRFLKVVIGCGRFLYIVELMVLGGCCGFLEVDRVIEDFWRLLNAVEYF